MHFSILIATDTMDFSATDGASCLMTFSSLDDLVHICMPFMTV